LSKKEEPLEYQKQGHTRENIKQWRNKGSYYAHTKITYF